MREHVKCLHHVGIPTRDMDATVRFYTDLGAEVYFQKLDQEAGEPIRVVIFDFYGMKVEAYEPDSRAPSITSPFRLPALRRFTARYGRAAIR